MLRTHVCLLLGVVMFKVSVNFQTFGGCISCLWEHLRWFERWLGLVAQKFYPNYPGLRKQ